MFATTFTNSQVLAVDFSAVTVTRNWLIEQGCEFTAMFSTDHIEVVYFTLWDAPAAVVDKLNLKFNRPEPQFHKWSATSGMLAVPADKADVTRGYVKKYRCNYEMVIDGIVAFFAIDYAPEAVVESLWNRCGVEEPVIQEPAANPLEQELTELLLDNFQVAEPVAMVFGIDPFDIVAESEEEFVNALVAIFKANGNLEEALEEAKKMAEEPEECTREEIEFERLPELFTNEFAFCNSAADVKRVYKELARTIHPDAGGSTEAMQKLNNLKDQALKEFA